MGLPKGDHPRRDHLPVKRRRLRRDAISPRRGAAHGDFALDLHQILHGDGDTVQRADTMAGTKRFIRRLGGQTSIRRENRDISLKFGFQPLRATQAVFDQLDRRQPPGGDLGGQAVDGQKRGR